MTDRLEAPTMALIVGTVEAMVEQRLPPDAFTDDTLRVRAESLIDTLDTALKSRPAVFVRDTNLPESAGHGSDHEPLAVRSCTVPAIVTPRRRTIRETTTCCL